MGYQSLLRPLYVALSKYKHILSVYYTVVDMKRACKYIEHISINQAQCVPKYLTISGIVYVH